MENLRRMQLIHDFVEHQGMLVVTADYFVLANMADYRVVVDHMPVGLEVWKPVHYHDTLPRLSRSFPLLQAEEVSFRGV